MNLRERMRTLTPTREQIHANRWLVWLGPWLHQPKLWRWSRRGVALGVALGVFFGLLIPIAQIPVSIAASVLLRANIPAAAASTLITNPVTFAPIYYGAYHLGSWVTSTEITATAIPGAVTQEFNTEHSTWQRITAMGKPLLTGLAITATLCGLLTYALITLIWRWRTMSKWRNRKRI